MTIIAESPDWFASAITSPAHDDSMIVDGARIIYRVWGAGTRPGILLVHGGAAHAHWWDHVAPLLADDHTVAALDLSGHGDSDRRPRYSIDQWSREVLAVAATLHHPTVIGHSMGGLVTLRAAAIGELPLAGAIAVDSPIGIYSPDDQAASERLFAGVHRAYPSREEAASRFRPVPEQCSLTYVHEHIAKHSVREVDGGWSWKWDLGIFQRPAPMPDLLQKIDGNVAFLRAQNGMVDEEMKAVIAGRLGEAVQIAEIPNASHHVMLDQPLALVEAIRVTLARWNDCAAHGK
jgi:pimeloyl-ACP methyl ester carboxylesterase